MKKLVYLILLTFIFSCGRIHNTNEIRESSYTLSQDSLYDSARTYYRIAFDSLELNDEILRFNSLSNGYHLSDSGIVQLYTELVKDSTFTNDSLKSKIHQQLGLIDIVNLKIQDIAPQQLGSIQMNEKLLSSAIKHTENALRAHYKNTEARNNLELLYVIQDLNKNNQDQNKDQQNKDQENKDQQDKEKQDQKNQEQQDKQQNKDQKQEGEGKKEQDQNGEQQKDQQDQKGEGEKDEKKSQNKQGKEGDKKDQEEQSQQASEEDGEQKEGEEKQAEPGSLRDQQEKQKAEQQKLLQQRLQEQGLSKEQMDQLLRSLNEQNKKYIQQIRKEPTRGADDDNKPDW